ncbi:P-loop NTPase fold protein [Achromobacter sp. SLBN-14]|uniref:P-loop NTPase fold protein n=1 Tax=Achromobacter sp. SLBN-14 TaxID=2768442 RepID=UPI0011528DFF|nr:P-loop NTPase fold protein [Achromobacter sp. SLBN-14]TQJ94707.1 KAP-like P-loop domain-containing protein [Achromobacter sp. SLBN-14]
MSLAKTKRQLIGLIENTENKVVALSGRWGTGKTHLWNEVKKESKDVEVGKALYVSLFGLSNIDQVKRKLMEGALPDGAVGGGKLEILKGLFKSGVTVAATHYKALAAINDLNLLLVAPIVLKNRVIVIDDIERKHTKLGIDEILGFIDEYSKEHKVRFVLVLNDDQLTAQGEQWTLWNTFREKVIDREIKLSTTSDEAFSIAIRLRASPKYERALKPAIVTCGLTNIRIIEKVIRVANQILANRDLSDSIQARVVPSIVLFGAIHYQGLEDGPDFQFALNIGTARWSRYLRDKEDAPTEEDKRKERWRMLIGELGIIACDGFELVLVEYLESGLFESEQVQAIIDRYVGEAQTFEDCQRARNFIRKALWDPRAVETDLIAEATDFPAIAGQFDPTLATEVHDVLKELDGGQDLAGQVIQAWTAAFQAREHTAQDDDNPFLHDLHPSIQAALDNVVAQHQDQASVVDACNYIFDTRGWGTLQEVAMKRATAETFEMAIRELGYNDWPRFMQRMIQMRLQRTTYDPHFDNVTDRFMDACRSVANDRRPESARLAKLVRRLFTGTPLALELGDAPPTRE